MSFAMPRKQTLYIMFKWVATISIIFFSQQPIIAKKEESKPIRNNMELTFSLDSLTGINKKLIEKLKNTITDYGDLINNNIITIIDFTLPSTEKRLWTFDLSTRQLLINSLVAHGKNSGDNIANKFSNKFGTNQSSLGLYVTGKPYFGKNGYSLRIIGLEKGINDNAFDRAVVIHPADYVSEDFIKKYGRLGRSFGCPAIPVEISNDFIDLVKEGSLLFIYHDSYQ